MTIGNIKSLIAAYFIKEDGTPAAVSDFVIDGTDILLPAINNARRQAELAYDFNFAQCDAQLILADVNGASIEDATLYGGSTAVVVKNPRSVLVPVTGGDWYPLEFISNDAWVRRVQSQIGRRTYDSTKTLVQLGVTQTNPVAVINGRTIVIVPSAQFTYPITIWMNVTRFLPNYTDDSTEDFFTKYAPEYLQWRTILDVNKKWKNFVPRTEGNIDENAIEGFAQEALASLIAWDRAGEILTNDTTQPPATGQRK